MALSIDRHPNFFRLRRSENRVDGCGLDRRRFAADRNCKAFSLLEMLVAMTILSMLVVLTSSAYQSVVTGYARIADESRQREESRSVLLFLSEEIRAALTPVSRASGVVVADMGSSAPGLDFLINPPALSATPEGRAFANPHTIFWQAPARDGIEGSALVGYAVRWEIRNDGTSVPVLRRLKSDSGRMFKELSLAAETPGSSWANPQLLESLSPATVASAYKGWMGDHILALWIRALDPQGNPITRTARPITGVAVGAANFGWPGTTLGAAQAGASSFDSKLGYQYSTPAIDCFAPALPAAVEIAITSAPPSVLRRLATPIRPEATLGVDPTKFWDDIAAFVETFPADARSGVRTYSTIVPLSAAR